MELTVVAQPDWLFLVCKGWYIMQWDPTILFVLYTKLLPQYITKPTKRQGIVTSWSEPALCDSQESIDCQQVFQRLCWKFSYLVSVQSTEG